MGLTTDRNDACLGETRPDGQQECYLILSEEERAKGFVRPVRRSYRHVACGTVTRMGEALAETYARDPGFYGGTFCVGCGSHFDLVKWEKDGEAPMRAVRQFEWADAGEGTPAASYVGE